MRGQAHPLLDAAERAAVFDEAACIAAGAVPLFACQTVHVATPPDWNAALDPDDIKPMWELNRHLHLVRLAQAFALGRETRWHTAVSAQLASWLAQCPADGKNWQNAPNWKSGLELGIRLINWSLIWQLLQGDIEDRLRTAWLGSIHAHCTLIAARFSRHSSANNHLIGELAGLYVAACIWPCWPESRAWRMQAQRELEQEVRIQFSRDGVHREQAFAYHVFCCEFLLLAGLVAQACNAPFSPRYWAILRLALHFIDAAGDVACNVGDADDGRVWCLQSGRRSQTAQLLALGGILFEGAAGSHPGALWLRHLFPGPVPEVQRMSLPSSWAWPDAGYYLFGTKGYVQGMVDCGPHGYLGIAAHGHADALALTLNVAGAPCLVDPGTYAYWCAAHWRDYFRGTSAHNTVRVDGVDQSVGGGRFLWLRKAVTRVDRMPDAPHVFHLSASHDGYQRLRDPVRHARTVVFDEASHKLVVTDCLHAKLSHRMETFWHFAPWLDVQLAGQGVVVRTADYVLTLQASSGALALVRGADEPPLGWYAQTYNAKAPCTVLRIVNESRDLRLECRITITFL